MPNLLVRRRGPECVELLGREERGERWLSVVSRGLGREDGQLMSVRTLSTYVFGLDVIPIASHYLSSASR